MTNTDHALLAERLFLEGYNCAQALFCAFSDITGYDIPTSARIASSFGGGLGRMRETCGAVSAAALVLGIAKGYSDPADREAKKRHYALVREFADAFREKHGSIRCADLLSAAGLAVTVGGDPEIRTASFYERRPCPGLIRDAAAILEKMLSRGDR